MDAAFVFHLAFFEELNLHDQWDDWIKLDLRAALGVLHKDGDHISLFGLKMFGVFIHCHLFNSLINEGCHGELGFLGSSCSGRGLLTLVYQPQERDRSQATHAGRVSFHEQIWHRNDIINCFRTFHQTLGSLWLSSSILVDLDVHLATIDNYLVLLPPF